MNNDVKYTLHYIYEHFFYVFIQVLFVLLLTWIAAKLINRGLKYIIRYGYRTTEYSQYNFIFYLATGLVYFIGILGAISVIPPLKPFAYSIFASSGIIALVFSLASQQAASQIVNGFFIQIFKPFAIGDHIKVGKDNQGIVKDITLRHTVLLTEENKTILIPNSTINTSIIENLTHK